MIESFDGAIASEPVASDGRSSVRGVHVPVPGSYVQMPPCAAPRTNSPLLGRIARAPMRPDIAEKIGVLRVTWTIGLGPSPVQAPVNVAGPAVGTPSLRM